MKRVRVLDCQLVDESIGMMMKKSFSKSCSEINYALLLHPSLTDDPVM